jgi:hypothetical protein
MTIQQSTYESWSNEDLIRAATVDRQDYLPKAMIIIEAELKRRNVSSEERNQGEQQILSDRNLRTQKLAGVRGWLLVFALIVIGNSIAAISGGVAAASQVLENPIASIALLPLWAFGVYGCYLFVILLRKKNNAPKHASRWLIAGFVLTLLYAAVVYMATREFSLTPLYGIATLVWLQYLDSSKRVAATYGKPLGNVEQPHAAEGAAGRR